MSDLVAERRNDHVVVVLDLKNHPEMDAAQVAEDIVGLFKVANAYPAYFDGFGHIVQNGETVRAS